MHMHHEAIIGALARHDGRTLRLIQAQFKCLRRAIRSDHDGASDRILLPIAHEVRPRPGFRRDRDHAVAPRRDNAMHASPDLIAVHEHEPQFTSFAIVRLGNGE